MIAWFAAALLSASMPLQPGDVMEEWKRAHGAKDPVALAAVYAPNAVHHTVARHEGRDAIQALFARELDLVRAFHRRRDGLVEGDGVAWEWGRIAQCVVAPDGGAFRIEGQHMALLRKMEGEDGESGWLIDRLSGASDWVGPSALAKKSSDPYLPDCEQGRPTG